MKRVGSNYSPEQLSYLIGKPDDYVAKVELLEADLYTAEDLRCIATALGDEEVDSYYPLHTDESQLVVSMQKEYTSETCIYTCNILEGEEVAYNYFTLKDDSERSIQSIQDSDSERSLVTDALQLLLKADFFYEEQMAVKVQMALQFILARKLNPCTIKSAIKDFCAGQQPLLQTVMIENARLGYQQP